MTDEPLEELYFRWLYRQVAPLRQKNPARTYWSLLRQLHHTEFVWFVPNDDNRAEDGKYLRYEFVNSLSPAEQLADHDWMDLGCSMLEMLIALARRLSFFAGGESSGWFWHMMDNVGLRGCSDAKPCSGRQIDQVVKRILGRTYEPNGSGGLFPLRDVHEDQRQVEIWYQMNNYIIERG